MIIAVAREGDREIEGQKGRDGDEERRVYRIINNGTSPVDTHLLVIARGLSPADRDDERQWQDQRWRSLSSSVSAQRCPRTRPEH